MSHAETESIPSSSASMLDAEWLAAPRRRSRLRAALLVLVVAGLVFLGGVEVQKAFGSSSTSAGASSGFPVGGLGGAVPGGFGGTASAGSSTTSSAGTGGTPVLVGTVTVATAHSWTVKDLGGKTHTVHTTASTTITRPLSTTTAPISNGALVAVQGTTKGGRITASSITIR
jgi:hypothetical protein